MSKSPEIVAQTPPAPESIRTFRFNLDWVTRPLFGVVLAALAIGSIVAGTWYFAVVAAVTAVAAVREWHRIVESGGPSREFAISAAAIPLGLAALVLWPHGLESWLVGGMGAVVVLISAALRRSKPVWHAAGIIYVGAPALLLVSLRASAAHATWSLIGLFLVVWSTDTGALVAGNLIGGPKLMPSLSPQKTWAGTIGGVVSGALAGSLYIAVIRGNALSAAVFAALLALVAHAGDLLESWVKRQFRFKDSGGLIPGHGGALDRIDSTLAASIVMAAAVLLFGFDPTFGARL